MKDDKKEIKKVFQTFVEGALVEHDVEKSLSVITEDVIGIGMGDQGVAECKDDIKRILKNEKEGSEETKTVVTYENMQIRCYEERFGNVCAILRIKTLLGEETAESSMGQIVSVRKENGRWKICALQATPLFVAIEDMEAYPIKFAENALEQYHMQEEFAKNARKDSVAIYKVNFSMGVFESSVLKNDLLIPTQEGEGYEEAMFEAAKNHLAEVERYQFIRQFSLGNIFRMYNSGKKELSMEYEMLLSEEDSRWMRTDIWLYMDKSDGNLKGYLHVIDIDEEKRKEIELQYKVQRDPMTEVYNRKYSELLIEKELKEINLINQGAFFMIDLDHFKEINDTYGHKEGDRVIKEAAACIEGAFHKNDIVGRLGGDEFCAYCHGELTIEEIEKKAREICHSLHETYLEGRGTVSCSIGVVCCTNNRLTFEEIYQKADQALYEQKKKGRNGYTVYNGFHKAKCK